MVGFPPKEILPVPSLPEPESLHSLVIVTHRGVTVRGAMEIQIDELFQVGTNDLVCVDEYNLLEVHGEKNVQEKNLVAPNDPLLFPLSPEPGRPLVCDELILETILLREVRYEFLKHNVTVC